MKTFTIPSSTVLAAAATLVATAAVAAATLMAPLRPSATGSSGNAASLAHSIPAVSSLVTQLAPVIVVAHRITAAEKIRLAQLERSDPAIAAIDHPRHKS